MSAGPDDTPTAGSVHPPRRRYSSPRSAPALAILLAALTALMFGALQANAATDWSDEVIYFVLVDRYADGDPGNNGNADLDNPGAFHGGDLKGLADHLDDIADLGVTALWINPVQKQIPQGVYAQAPAKLGIAPFTHWGFHGYWIDDFTAVDPHFGTLADLQHLVAEAHKRHIKVLLDVVYNHAGYGTQYLQRRTSDGQAWMRNSSVSCDIDPIHCNVGGLPDFRTELPEVRDYLLDANIGLARDAGADGFRLDTYKHVGSEFWQLHRARTRSELGAGFFLLAEIWGGTAASLDPYFARDEIDAGFDFSFKGSCESFADGRGRAIAFGSYLAKRHTVRAGHFLAHYLSSHDEPMAFYELGGDKAKFRLCVAVQMTSLGIPVIYYGEEVARSGSEWPLNRGDMPWGERDIRPGKGLARDEAMRDYYKSLLRIRHKHPALSHGDYVQLSRPTDSFLAYARRDEASGDRVVVVINRESRALDAQFDLPGLAGKLELADELGGSAAHAENGRVSASLGPESVLILNAANPGNRH